MPPRMRGGPPWQRQGEPPPWWPEGEPWPPERRPPGARLGRRFAIWLVALLVLVVTAMAIINHARGTWGPPEGEGPPGPFFWPPLALLAIGSLVFFLVRKVIRTFRPLAEVVNAAERVAEGDYAVRVTTRSGRETAGIVNAFNTMATRLEANEQQRQRLLSDIAHELRTPVAVVQGTVEAMLDGVYPLDRDTITPLLDQTHAVSRLLDDLQTLATAEAGVLPLYRTETSLDDLATGAVAAFEPVASRKGVALRAITGAPDLLDIDGFRMRQVLDNLLTNAIRHTPAGGSIEVTTRMTATTAAVVVRDTGSGMDPADAARMFERFVKSADSGGTGLGLAIARGLVEAHGGTIGATSEPDRGTTVTVILPRPE